MSTLGKAVIEFSADTAKFVGDVGRTAAMFDKSMGRMESGIASMRNALVAAAGLGGFGAMIKSTIDAGDQLNKLSQKVGVSVEHLSELKFAADLADVGMDDLTRGFKEFNKTLTEATDPNSKAAGIFAALGVSPSGDPAADLRKVSDAFAQLQDGATKTTIASELFGKSGLAWIPLLNQGGKALDDAADKARKMGLVIGPELAKQSEQFNDNLRILTKQTEALGVSLTQHVIGGLTTLTTRLAEGAEKGSFFTSMLRESVFLITALGEKIKLIPQPLGAAIFGALDGTNRKGVDFNQVMKDHNARWGLGGAAPGAAAGAPNPEALACAATGGKWVGGKCVRAGGTKKQDDNLVGNQWAWWNEEEVKLMSEANAEADKFNQRMRENAYWENMGMTKEQHAQWMQTINFMQEMDIQTGQIAAGFDGMDNAIQKVAKSSTNWGFTFDSALENLIVKGGKLSDVFKAVGEDFARMIARKGITEPLGNAVGGILGKIDFGNIFGGGGGDAALLANQAGLVGSFASGTDFVPRDGLAMVHKGEAIIPASENAGGATNINVTLNVGTLDGRAAAHVILANEPVITAMFRRAAKQRGQRSPV